MSDHLLARDLSSLSGISHFSHSLDGIVNTNPAWKPTTMESLSVEDLKNMEKLDESNILKHLAKDFRVSSTEQLNAQFAARTSNPQMVRIPTTPSASSSYGNLISKSQSDLNRSLTPSPKNEALSPCSRLDASPTYVTICDENAYLKQEVERLSKTIYRLQKVELELDKIHQSYLSLLQSTNKRELLENARRMQMETEKQILLHENQKLRDHVENISRQMEQRSPVTSEEDFIQAIQTRDVVILRLTAQNKELIEGQKRQEIELVAQRATLDEQRNHINILDSALTSAQGNVVKLEDEMRKKQQQYDRIQDLQQAFRDLQTTTVKREQMENRLRVQLEQEIEALKTGQLAVSAQRRITPSVSIDEINMQCRSSECLKPMSRKPEQNDIVEPKSSDASAGPYAVLKNIQQGRILEGDQFNSSNRVFAELEAKVLSLESRLTERDGLLRLMQVPTGENIQAKASGHARIQSQSSPQSVKESVSGQDPDEPATRMPQRPKSSASVVRDMKSQLWEI